MLWGDLCLTIMEQLQPSVVPLQLRWAGASDATIALLANSLPAALGLMLNPIVGVQSDRHRGRLGRRRPFLLWCTVPVVISLLLLGCADPAGRLVHSLLSGLIGPTWGAGTYIIGWLAFATIVFVIFNTYIMQVYQFLFADVIPVAFIGRFIGLYRAVGAVGGFLFNRFLFEHVQTHVFHVYLLAGLLYAASFMLLIWQVKEGSYPPPAPVAKRSAYAFLLSYLRDCYRHPFYLNLYCLAFFFWSGTAPFATFVVFFATTPGTDGYSGSLGLSLVDFAHVKSYTLLIQPPIFLAIGPLVDRYHPLRIAMIGLALTGACYVCSYFFIHDAGSLQLWYILCMATTAVYMGAYLALFPRLLPTERFGQFFTANQIFGFTGVVAAPILAGHLIEVVKDYRVIFLWTGVAVILGAVANVILYVQWKRLGGDKHYVPPS